MCLMTTKTCKWVGTYVIHCVCQKATSLRRAEDQSTAVSPPQQCLHDNNAVRNGSGTLHLMIVNRVKFGLPRADRLEEVNGFASCARSSMCYAWHIGMRSTSAVWAVRKDENGSVSRFGGWLVKSTELLVLLRATLTLPFVGMSFVAISFMVKFTIIALLRMPVTIRIRSISPWSCLRDNLQVEHK